MEAARGQQVSTEARGQSLPGLSAPPGSGLSFEGMGTGHPTLGVERPGVLGLLDAAAAPNTPLSAQYSAPEAVRWLVPRRSSGRGRLVARKEAGEGQMGSEGGSLL